MADIQGRMTPLEHALWGVKEPALSYGGKPSPPRPAVTAWQGADMDAYWWDGAQWLHCRTGEVWNGADKT